MSGEPKTLTPEQVVDLAKKYMVAYLEETSWPDELREKWPEELDADYRLLFEEDVPVVARDEAAELRAAVKRFLAAIDARDHFIEHEAELLPADWDAAFRRTGDEITDSVAALRRLAGGENEK